MIARSAIVAPFRKPSEIALQRSAKASGAKIGTGRRLSAYSESVPS